MKSVMTHQFSQVPQVEIPRSSFDRSHGYKTTFDSGYLIPVLVDEVLPGDTFDVKMTALSRMATPIYPVMDNMYMDTQFFAVPYRLIWDNFQKFMGEQNSPGDSTDFIIPTQTAPLTGGWQAQTLQDYLGIPTYTPGLEYSALFERAYNLIWNEWYRDQNLQEPAVIDTGDSGGNRDNYTLRRRGKRHDYFTSCLPWPQKGESVVLPLGDRAVVATDATVNGDFITVKSTIDDDYHAMFPVLGDGLIQLSPGGVEEDHLFADLTDATAATINQLRQAFQIQRMLERDARGGTRYTEVIKSHFGVTSPDARLQRPEYLGGGSTPINVTPVLATAQTNDPGFADRPLGDTGAFAITAIKNNGFTKSFTEHCIIIGLCSVRADLTYQQGLNRMFSRQTRYDMFWPALSNIGEQTVLNKEIFAQGTNDLETDEAVFGYQERYAEYRYKPSLITGKFRSADPLPLDSWHLSQYFENLPTLGETFIEENPPIDRVIAVQDEPQFIFDAYFSMRCVRPMPMFGVPGMIDHF